VNCLHCKHWKPSRTDQDGQGLCTQITAFHKAAKENEALREEERTKRRRRKSKHLVHVMVTWNPALFLKRLDIYVYTRHDFGCALFTPFAGKRRLPIIKDRANRLERVAAQAETTEAE
jgi:hypothetical protein